MNVAYVQPIFAPNDELLERNLKSVESFFKYYEKNAYQFRCIFGGYAATDELWVKIHSKIKELSLKCGTEAIIRRFKKNYGKAYVVNSLVTQFITEDYFLTADSDIQYDENQPNIVLRLIESFNHCKQIYLNPSLIALNQDQNNCHLLGHCYQNKYDYDGEFGREMVCRPDGGGGVAGGCLFISTAFWRKVGGYKVLGVYAGDDANLMLDSYTNGYHFFMADTIKCIHPFENNQDYLNWKALVCPQSEELEQSMRKANSFWSTQGIKQMNTEDDKKFSYVICHANTSEYRSNNLKSLVKYLRNNFGEDIEIVVSEQGYNKTEIEGIDRHVFFNDSGLFQRSKVLNRGVLACTHQKVFIGDNDVVIHIDSLKKTLKLLGEYEAVNPYNKIIDLSEHDSNSFRMFLNLYFENNWNYRECVVFSGGCFAILKDVFIDIGGFDEDIIGWGGEDDALTIKIAALVNYIGNDSIAYHLYHDRGFNGLPYHEHYNKNVEILSKVSTMTIEELKDYCKKCKENLK